MSYLFDGGYASDQGGKLGRAGFALGMLDEGAGKTGALEFAAAEENLGARLTASASIDGSRASLSALKENLDDSVALFADILRAPRFAKSEIDRAKMQWTTRLETGQEHLRRRVGKNGV